MTTIIKPSVFLPKYVEANTYTFTEGQEVYYKGQIWTAATAAEKTAAGGAGAPDYSNFPGAGALATDVDTYDWSPVFDKNKFAESHSLQALIDRATDGDEIPLKGTYTIDTPVTLSGKTVYFTAIGKVSVVQNYASTLKEPMMQWLNAPGTTMEGDITFEGADDAAIYDAHYPFTNAGANGNTNNAFTGLEIVTSANCRVRGLKVNNRITGICVETSPGVILEDVGGTGFATTLVTNPVNWNIFARVTSSNNVIVKDTFTDDYATNVQLGFYSYEYPVAGGVKASGAFLSNLCGKDCLDHGVYAGEGVSDVVIDGFYFENGNSSAIRVDNDGTRVLNGVAKDCSLVVSVRADNVQVSNIKGIRCTNVVKGDGSIGTGQVCIGAIINDITAEDCTNTSVSGEFTDFLISNIQASGYYDSVGATYVDANCYGMTLDNSERGTIRDINCHHTTRAAIFMSGCTDVSIHGITHTGTGTAWAGNRRVVRINDSVNTTLSGVRSSQCGIIEEANCTGSLFYDNVNDTVEDDFLGTLPRTL